MKKEKATHLIVGLGEIGSTIYDILDEKGFPVYRYDPRINGDIYPGIRPDVLHICYPYPEVAFVAEAKRYVALSSPRLIVNHSTVPPGTTRSIASNAVHSPIIGDHNDLGRHIRTIKKAVGINSEANLAMVKDYLSEIWKLEIFKTSEETELAKILNLARYAVNIEMARYAKKCSDQIGLDYDQVSKRFDMIYNAGYQAVGCPQYTRQILFPPEGKIGGHCIIPALKMAEQYLPSGIIREILKEND